MMFWGKTAIMATILALVAAVCPAAGRVVLDFESAAGAKMLGGEVVSEHAKSGTKALKWANHLENPRLMTDALSGDWKDSDTVAFWVWSAVANGARVTVLIGSNRNDNRAPSLYRSGFEVNWTGWKRLQFPLARMSREQGPIGPEKIDRLVLTTRGFDNAPKPDTVLVIDDVSLEKLDLSAFQNGSFESDDDGDGVPDGWLFFTEPGEDQEARIVPEGHTGRGMHLVDNNKGRGLGIRQDIKAEPGKTYRLTYWKKGGGIGMYIVWLDAKRKRIGEKSTSFKNKNRDAFEQFHIEAKCPPGAKYARAILYSYSSGVTDAVLDDVTLEKVD